MARGLRFSLAAFVLLVAGLSAAPPASREVQLVNETVVVRRGGARSIRVSLHQRPAAVIFRYANVRGGDGVRAILLTEAEAENFRNGRSFSIIATTPYGPHGQITKTVSAPGDYELVFDNTLEKDTRAVVRWQAALLFGHPEMPEVSYLPSERRAVVFAASGLFLLLTVGFTAGRVRTALVRRKIRESYWLSGGYPPSSEPPT